MVTLILHRLTGSTCTLEVESLEALRFLGVHLQSIQVLKAPILVDNLATVPFWAEAEIL